eukprot:gene5841-6539_t
MGNGESTAKRISMQKTEEGTVQVAAESTRTDDVSLCVRTPFAVPVPVSEEPMEDDPLPAVEIQINRPEDTERCNQVVEAEIVADLRRSDEKAKER